MHQTISEFAHKLTQLWPQEKAVEYLELHPEASATQVGPSVLDANRNHLELQLMFTDVLILMCLKTRWNPFIFIRWHMTQIVVVVIVVVFFLSLCLSSWLWLSSLWSFSLWLFWLLWSWLWFSLWLLVWSSCDCERYRDCLLWLWSWPLSLWLLRSYLRCKCWRCLRNRGFCHTFQGLHSSQAVLSIHVLRLWPVHLGMFL